MSREEFFRKELVEELRRVENLMRREGSIDKKLYYFSAAYGITSRTYRYAFSRDVLLADLVLSQAYNVLMDRWNQLARGDRLVPIEEVHFEKLCDGVKLLADKLEADENILEALEIITTVAFSTSGPGNYLREKGDLVL